jgi:hypothetical protein
MENPFAGLRPGMRSEHDEIRKGIFSRALRNMQVAPLEERREWCKAIRATYTSARDARQKRAAAVNTASTAAPSTSPASSTSSPAVGTKRTYDEAAENGPREPAPPATSVSASTSEAAAATTGDVAGHHVSGDPSVHLPSSPGSLPTAPVTATTSGGANSDEAAANGAAVSATAVEEEEEEDEASVKECIAAYLRSLLDRVVGVSLENLNVPALRVLCMMVGLKTEVRNKIALYSTLASFYFTECERLGKRVSRDTVYERQIEQEVAMLKQVAPTTATTGRKGGEKKAATSAAATTASQAPREGDVAASSVIAQGSSSSNRKAKAAPAAVVVSVTSRLASDNAVTKTGKKKTSPLGASTTASAGAAARSRQAVKAAKTEDSNVDHYLKYENYDVELGDETAEAKQLSSSHYQNTSDNRGRYGALADDADHDGEVVFEERVFSRPGSSTVTSAHMAKYASSSPTDEDEWPMPKLERSVASIVQLHDPVTVAIVVKKLAQLGYHDPNAGVMVEQILHRFHDRQLIFYDTGIAYLM